MASLNIFQNDAFSTFQLTAAVERLPYLPSRLGDMGIFEPKPIRDYKLGVEERQGILTLIPYSNRGQEGTQRTTERRRMRYFEVPRIMTSDTIMASELQSIREFGTETELMQVQSEVARRLTGPTGLVSNINYTWEYQRLAAVQGLLLDADGTIKYNWFDEFEISEPSEIAFDLDSKTLGSLRPKVSALVRDAIQKAQGAWIDGKTKLVALCGHEFYDKFKSHPDVEKTFLNWEAAQVLRDGTQGAFRNFEFEEVLWIDYRGSSVNNDISIETTKVKFFPLNAPGVFQVAYSPGENMDWVNTPGKPIYILTIPDLQRNSFIKLEAYSYPLHICTRPDMLFKGKAGA